MADNSPEGTPDSVQQDDPTISTGTASEVLLLDQQIGYYVDMWKKAVDVQQHFNDIQWRIRGLALTVATFSLGAAGIAAKDGTKIGPISLGCLVASVGLVLWYAFYFADRVWYHPFLKSAVAHGTVMEDEIRKTLPHAGLTAAITAGSEQPAGWLTQKFTGRPTLRSTDKLVLFYVKGGAAFVLVAVILQFGGCFASTTASSKSVEQVTSNTTSTPPVPTTSSPANKLSPVPNPASPSP